MYSCAHTDTRTHTRTHTHDWNACCFCLICSACTTLSCFSCPRGGLSLAHSRTHAHSIAFSLSHPHVLYFSRSLLLFLSRKHTPTNTHPYTPCSRTQIHTHTHSLSLSLCLSLSLNLTHTHISAARTCCKPSSYSLLHSHTSSPTHAPPPHTLSDSLPFALFVSPSLSDSPPPPHTGAQQSYFKYFSPSSPPNFAGVQQTEGHKEIARDVRLAVTIMTPQEEGTMKTALFAWAA